jgi:eukaryotic-like serine/threonine-protein kinase
MLNSLERQIGNYLLTRLLGRGGFADVYYGEHIYLKTFAAIKVLAMQLNKEKHEKFLVEAQIAARLDHPHILSVLEFGRENDHPYLVMDYAPHGTLRQRYPKGTRLHLNQVAYYVQQIANALQYIHDQQLIYCDMKPENMLLGSNDAILLSDFGIARAMQDTQQSGNGQHIVGTITYMAPEQLHNQACPASDQYALGVVLYEWLCGEPPFRGSYAEIAVQHALVSPVPLCERASHIPKAVEEVVMIALAKEPAARFKTIRAFANAFAQAYRSSQSETVASLFFPSLQSSSTTTPLQTEVHHSTAKRFSRRTLALGLLGGAGLAIGTTLAWQPLSQILRSSSLSPDVPSPGTTLYTYHGHPVGVNKIAWSRDSQQIVSSANNIQLWDATTGKLERIYSAGRAPGIEAMAWSPDNRYIAASMYTQLSLLETSTGKNVFSIYPAPGTDSGNAVAWSPDSQMIASFTKDLSAPMPTIKIWNAMTGVIRMTYKGHTADVISIAWSPDGKWIASSQGFFDTKGEVHIWEAATGRLQLIYPGHPEQVIAVAWSPDGKSIASAGSLTGFMTNTNPNRNTIQVWRPDSTKPLVIYHGHAGPVASLAWSPDSKFLVSSCGADSAMGKSASILVWEASTGHTLLTYQGYYPYSDWAGVVSWSPNGKMIASSNFGGAIQVWKAPF